MKRPFGTGGHTGRGSIAAVTAGLDCLADWKRHTEVGDPVGWMMNRLEGGLRVRLHADAPTLFNERAVKLYNAEGHVTQFLND